MVHLLTLEEDSQIHEGRRYRSGKIQVHSPLEIFRPPDCGAQQSIVQLNNVQTTSPMSSLN